MPQRTDKIKLGAFWYPTGYHIAAWRHPEVPPDAGINLSHAIDFAKSVEQAAFDFIFLADSLAVKGDNWDELSHVAHRYVGQFEPLTLLSAFSAVTSRIGLVASASTTYNHPYLLARQFASLNHLSHGRVGWNLVTSQNPYEAAKFGYEAHPEHDQRYQRANEFLEVMTRLWHSWDKDAFCYDKDKGIFFHPDKVHPFHFHGDFFDVKGPLNVPPHPSGSPVLVQAGASEPGRQLAAQTAEVIFSAQHDLHTAQQFYADIRHRAETYQRQQPFPLIMTGIFPFVGRTESKAREKYEQLQNLIHDNTGLSLLSMQLGGIDLSNYDPDGPLPEIPPSNSSQSRRMLLLELAQRENYTIRELARHVAGARGHWQLVGTPSQIVDEMQAWFEQYATDGFNVMSPWLPGGMEDFIKLIIPELRHRGLFRHTYQGRTLREHLME
ncbi:LLM class flavin-dependent oxidoreductase [Vibrio ruber]|uniref:LLM class flavin-dependent oxidoreductase n=1 Tax=Vibrio ruber TaxID=184755 RepID=UPI0028934BD4|nr:LLM class flavin-dependent oxidoreductase [Vibrio ruber]WNJ97287.1 LLM class flavin-dependent oxidoreductase [Vibrio ruber]